MKLELIGHDEKYALEQSLLTLFPGEKPVYGMVDKTADTRWARVTLTEEDERVQVTTELGVDGKSAAHSYDYPLSGTEYEKEGQRRHAVGISFFGAAKDLLGISPAWGSLTGVRPSKVALSLIREGGKKRAEKELQELYCVTPARAPPLRRQTPASAPRRSWSRTISRSMSASRSARRGARIAALWRRASKSRSRSSSRIWRRFSTRSPPRDSSCASWG